MKKTILIFTIGIILISCKTKIESKKSQESEISNNKELLANISTKIDSLYVLDQKIQLDIEQAFKDGENEKKEKLFLEEKVIFRRHIPILKDIFRKIGYPTIELVGKENSRKFFIMVQHSDSDVKFQEEMLKEISKELEKGNVSGRDFAFLTDRVQLAQEKPQVYGTQLDYNTDIAQVFPRNLIDSLNVNKRREKIGLEPIENYLNKAIKMHFENNRLHYDKIGIKEPKLYKTE